MIGRGGPGDKSLPPHSKWRGQLPQPQRPPFSLVSTHPQQEQGLPKPTMTTHVGSVGKCGT